VTIYLDEDVINKYYIKLSIKITVKAFGNPVDFAVAHPSTTVYIRPARRQ
jgi:hypothetical protein